MTINDPQLRRYYRAIRNWLPCGHRKKKQIIGQIRNDVQEYVTQNPNSDFTMLQAALGDPQTIAAAHIENMNTMELLRDLKIRRRIVAIVAITMAVILFSWAGSVTWAIASERHAANGYVEVVIK